MTETQEVNKENIQEDIQETIFDRQEKRLRAKLNKLSEEIIYRKTELIKSEIWNKINVIVETFGKWDDWGGSHYSYRNSGLKIDIENNCWFKVKMDDKDVLCVCKNGTVRHGDVYLYISGEWEKIIDKLYTDSLLINEVSKLDALRHRVKKLQNEWEL